LKAWPGPMEARDWSLGAAGDDMVAEGGVDGRKVLVGLGNRYMKDDGVGLVVAEELKPAVGGAVAVLVRSSMDLGLLWELRGASLVVIVDAVRTGAQPGTVTALAATPSVAPLERLPGLHSLELLDVLDLARSARLDVPPLVLVGVEPSDCSPGEGLTDPVREAVPRLVAAVREKLGLTG